MRVFPASSHLSLVGTNGLLLLASILMHSSSGEDNPAILQIRVIEGEGVAYSLGGRATRGVTVQVTDETGKPIEGASVSFRLPEDGPSGVFASGSRTELGTTKADGRASVWGMQWNHTEGSFEIRITAVKGQARAGTVCPIYLARASVENDSPAPAKLGRNHKWLWIAVTVAGGAAIAVAVGALANSKSTSIPVGPTATPTSIGSPTIVIGH